MRVGSDERRQAMGWGSGTATVPIENRDENIRSEAGVGVTARLALSRCGKTTRPGAILAEPVGVALAA
jgi:hypothetical protein